MLSFDFTNRETTTFMKQYNQQRSVTTALSQLELDSMEQHLWMELTRQKEEAASRKLDCKQTIDIVIADVEKVSFHYTNELNFPNSNTFKICFIYLCVS